MKECTKCKELLPLTEFSKEKRSKDGLNWRCRKCAAALRKEWIERARLVGNKKAGTHSPERRKTWPSYKSKPTGKDRHPSRRLDKDYWRSRDSGYKVAYPGRLQVTWKLQAALRSGKIERIDTQVCTECGLPAQEYHHSDYNKPLDVIPMCKSCHRKWHLANKPIEAI